MKKIFKYKLSNKIFISFLFIIFIPAILSFFFTYRLIIKSFNWSTESLLKNNIEIFWNEIKILEEKSKNIAVKLSNDTNVKKLLLNNNLEINYNNFINIYDLNLIDIIQIRDINNEIIFSEHHYNFPLNINLDNDIIQKTINSESYINYLTINKQFTILTAVPIIYNDIPIGIIIVGINFPTKLLFNIELSTYLELGIYKNNNKVISTYKEYNDLTQDIINKLNENCYYYHNDIILDNESFDFIFKPIYIYDDIYWGCLALGVNKFEKHLQLKYLKLMLYIILFSGILIAIIINSILSKNINKSLYVITEGIENIDLNKYENYIDLKSNDEFMLIANSFNKLIRQLNINSKQIQKLQNEMVKTERLRTAGQIASGIAHEIRNPLSSIKMMFQIIQKRYIKNINSKETKVIMEEIDRINNLLKEMLE